MSEIEYFIDWQSFPDVPEILRPKALFHASTIKQEDIKELQSKGWLPTDVRLLPDKEMEQRVQAVLAWLSGVRMGSIIPMQGQAKIIELEMRACGLHVGKAAQSTKKEIASDDLEAILDFGKK
jgi:hypothetical protein